MSWNVVAWANDQPTESPSSHLVLVQLANIAGQDGVVRFLDVDYLARVSKQSRRSVFRRLGEFERAGVLTREIVSHTCEGRPVTGAKLHLDRPWQAMQETHGEDDAESGENGAVEAGLSANLALDPEEGCDTQRMRVCHSYGTPSPYVPKEKDISIPPNPPADAGRNEGADGEETLDVWFLKFQASYPFDATMNPDDARRAAAALSVKDRAKALRWAPDYAADLKHRGATRPLDAAKWLRERRFEGVEQVRSARAKSAGLEKPLVFVAKGTRAWEAWVAHGHKPGLDSARQGGRNGWWFASLWPPGHGPPDGESAG